MPDGDREGNAGSAGLRSPGSSERVPLARKAKPTSVERIKQASDHLRGTLREALLDEAPGLSEDDRRIVKFHGIYQQENRDERAAHRASGEGRKAEFMVRLKLPAGQLTAAQYLAMDALADEVVYDRSLRITTRQNFQLHGVLKGELKRTIQRVDEVLLSTLCGCGDVERNVVAPPAPIAHDGHRLLHALAFELAEAMAPATNAYREIWLDGERIDSTREHEALYGEGYLPRKFKTGLALPEDDSAEVYDQDVGLIGIVERGELRGANVLVGGGSGMTHRKRETYARLGTPLGFVERANLVETVKTIARIYRDFGDRTDRRHARLKYVVEEWGIDAFRAEFQQRVAFPLEPWVETAPLVRRDWLGANPQGDGRWLYGIWIESGRIVDGPQRRWKTALREIVAAMQPTVALTPQQNLIVAGLAVEQIPEVEAILDRHGLPRPDRLDPVRRSMLACPALPTCGLALTEAERVADAITADFEALLRRLALDDVPFSLRITGCPNGCARPYDADVGIVGRKPGHYDVYVGGGLGGNRLGELHAESLPQSRLAAHLEPLLRGFSESRRPEEGLGDYYDRVVRGPGRRDILSGAKGDAAEPGTGGVGATPGAGGRA
ncbi:MAG: NADPH-dependent assimilatory sulfite reductase hemoprotein subunit [Myxococcota bacterium]